jgi:hypothetical protein
MAQIIRTSRSGIMRVLAQFGLGTRESPKYRWYEVEVACF